MDHQIGFVLVVLLPMLEARPLQSDQTTTIGIFAIDSVLLLLLVIVGVLCWLKISAMKVYPLRDTPMTPIKQRSSRRWFKHVNEIGVRDIRLEFTGFVKHYTPPLTTKAFDDDANQLKNRYDDVALLDQTRVKIKLNPENDDYIHASYVEIFRGLTYICTQGPLTNTIHQFWIMCIQEEVNVILQLCQNIEEDEEKCADYLPTNKNWTSFGPIKVKVVEKVSSVSNIDKLVKTVVCCKFEDREVTITHLLYSGWPDRAPPETVSACVELRKLVKSLCKRKPIVLHCSAGIGRTGTFVAIDMVCHKILNELKPRFEMVDLVKELRNKRRQAVQNNIQYIFIYRCVIEILIAEHGLRKTDEVAKFIEDYDNVVARKATTKKKSIIESPGNPKSNDRPEAKSAGNAKSNSKLEVKSVGNEKSSNKLDASDKVVLK